MAFQKLGREMILYLDECDDATDGHPDIELRM